MDVSLLFPPEASAWALRYGLFTALVGFLAFVFALLIRPFWLWYSGRSEELDRLRRLEETSRKALLELEILNKTLSIPLKKAAKKAPEADIIVSQETKDGLLEALARSRKPS